MSPGRAGAPDQERGLLALCIPQLTGEGKRVSARRKLAHYIQDLHLVSVLDELRDAYDIAKNEGYSELQNALLRTRRTLLQALHETLNLYGENAELHQQLSEALAQLRHFRETGARSTVTAEITSGRITRKLS